MTWDVTLDVLQALANGKTEVNWLVRFANESANGMVKYYSKEGAAQNKNYSLGPQLVLAPWGAWFLCVLPRLIGKHSCSDEAAFYLDLAKPLSLRLCAAETDVG